MTNLHQDKYKDDNGREIEASTVGALAPYRHIADGFYHWTCGHCGHKHASRSCGWPISGQVLECSGDGCGVMNLLVRTNCEEIDVALAGKWRVPERDRELERLNGVVDMNEQKVLEVKRCLTSLVSIAISNWRLPIEQQREHTQAVGAVARPDGVSTE